MNRKLRHMLLLTAMVLLLFACVKQSNSPTPQKPLSHAMSNAAQTMADHLGFGSATLYNDDNHYCYSYIRDNKLVVPYWERDKKCTTFTLPQGFTPSANWRGYNYSPIMGEVGKGKWIGITDCSGFAADIVNRVSPAAFKEFVALARQESPLKKWYQPWPDAANYAHLGPYLVNNKIRARHWKVIATRDTLAEVLAGKGDQPRPGDILSWAAPKSKDGGDSGHVMIIRTWDWVPGPGKDMSKLLVDVFDSSVFQHAADDTRPKGKTGIGSGKVAVGLINGQWQVGIKRPDNPTGAVTILRVML